VDFYDLLEIPWSDLLNLEMAGLIIGVLIAVDREATSNWNR